MALQVPPQAFFCEKKKPEEELAAPFSVKLYHFIVKERGMDNKEWIEMLKFWIQFFTDFGNFTDFSSKFCKISGIFNEFKHFGTCSRNPDKFSSKFR